MPLFTNGGFQDILACGPSSTYWAQQAGQIGKYENLSQQRGGGSRNERYASMAISPKEIADLTGGKVLHLTFEIDSHFKNTMRWTAVALSPAGDPLAGFRFDDLIPSSPITGTPAPPTAANSTDAAVAAGHVGLNKSNQALWFQIFENTCDAALFNGIKNPSPGTTAGAGAVNFIAPSYTLTTANQAYFPGFSAPGRTPPAPCDRKAAGGHGLSSRSRFDLFITTTNLLVFEDGNSTPFVKQAIQNATSTGLPFSQAKIYFIHYGHAMNDLVEGSAIKGGDGLTPSDLPGADAYFQSNWVCSGANPPVAARPLVDKYILTPWQSNPLGKLLLNQKIDLNVAPFRLLAIANRIDQRAVNGAGQAVDAGGGRFVFGAVYNNGSACVRLPFTMIFEYQQKATGNAALLALANQWHALGGAAWGPSYNSALQQLTAQFSAGSSPVLTALRTNEVALAPIAQSWEMREFHLGSTGFALAQATANPDASLDNTPALANVMNSYNCVTNPMAATDQGAVAPNAPALWNAPGASPTQRHQFALNGTCAGCHYLETGTFGFTHVAPRERATPATLSSFLTGCSTAGTACCGGSTVTVQDPVTPGDAGPGPYTFNEMKRRADYLGTLLSAGVNPPGGGCVP